MGLPTSSLQFLAREHKRKPFSDGVVLLGRQNVYSTYMQTMEILKKESIKPALYTEEECLTNIEGWKHTQFISDAAFFWLLGLKDVQALDFSDYEGAEIIQDLNQPLPDDLKQRFNLVVDGGTLEHVFDVRQTLTNIATMLKPGGRIIHMSPFNNYTNHGFYQLNPTLYYDYYSVNKFTELHAYLVEHPVYWDGNPWTPWDVYEISPALKEIHVTSTPSTAMLLLFCAEKTDRSTTTVIPAQGRYARLVQEVVQPIPVLPIASEIIEETAPQAEESVTIPSNSVEEQSVLPGSLMGLRDLGKKIIPVGVWVFFASYFRRAYVKYKNQPVQPSVASHSATDKWGLKYWGHFE